MPKELLTGQNTNYISNHKPLLDVPFVPLPLGTVKADRWLLKQLELQRDGLTGNAELLYNEDDNLGAGCHWLGGNGNSWERAPYYIKGLIALAYTLNDTLLITKANKWIDYTLDHQKANGNFGPDNNIDWWPRMPMLYAIRDFYEVTNDSRVIPFLTGYFRFQSESLEHYPLNEWAKARAGDNIEIVLWLYNHTGNTFLLSLADKLKAQAYDWTTIFTENKFMHYGGDFYPRHNVNIAQAMKMPAIYYQRSNSEVDKEAFVKGRTHLLRDHGQPEGMQSGNEMIVGKSSLTGLELCSIVEQMQSCETAQMILGEATIGDQLEKIAFNALPGALSKDIKGLQYYTQANQVKSVYGNYSLEQQYDNAILPGPYSGYKCCRYDFHMGWPYFVKTMWTATNDNGLAVMAYGPCHLTAKVANGRVVTITETTNYPFNEDIVFKIELSKPVKFSLKLRIPQWCSNPVVEVNGEKISNINPGTFITINREWKNNDFIKVAFPMELKVNNEVNNAVSIERGPLVYSLRIREDWKIRRDYGNGFCEYEIFPESDWNYALIIDKERPEKTIQVNRGIMPENPFIQEQTPVTLTAKARKILGWNYALNGIIATDPPYSPVSTDAPVKTITLVPFGAENLRVTCFPFVGMPSKIENHFKDDFEDGVANGWVNYSGCFYIGNGEYRTTRVVGRSGGKTIQTATNFKDFSLKVKMQVGNAGNAGIIFKVSEPSLGPDEYKGYYLGISAADNKIILGKANNTWSEISSYSKPIEENTWYDIKIVTNNKSIKIYFNNMEQAVIDASDDSFQSGAIGFRTYDAEAKWDDLVVEYNNKEY